MGNTIIVKDQDTGDQARAIRPGRASMSIKALAAPFVASLMDGCPVDQPGTIQRVYVAVGQLALAVGESASLTFLKNGVAILTAPVAVPAGTAANAVFDISSTIAQAQSRVSAGDEFTLTVGYTAGGGPAHPNLSASVMWG